MKKVLSLILAIALCSSLATTSLAATDEAEAAANRLFAYGLFLGKDTNADGTPNFDLDAEISRVEALTLFVRLLGKEDEAQSGTFETPFTDIPDWAAAYVGYAYENALTNGISDTQFGSYDSVSGTQFLTFVLRALGYISGEDFAWNHALELTDKIGLTTNGALAGASFGEKLLRGDVVVICVAAVETAVMKDSETTLRENIEANLGYKLDLEAYIRGNGDTYTLTIHNHEPHNSATGKFLEEWARRVHEASYGRLSFDILHGGTLGSARDTYDFIKTGVCDIGLGLTSYFPMIFQASEAIALPMLPFEDVNISNQVFWNLYASTELIASEFENLHVLLLHTSSQSPIGTKNFEIKTVEDLAGLNIRTTSGLPTEFLLNLGASPVSVVSTDLYAAINTNAIDAVITDWHTIKSFQLFEPIGYYLEANIGVSGYFFAMNKDVYAGLPEELRYVLDICSGEAALEYCGSFWNDVTTAVMADIAAEGGIVYTLSAEEQAKLQTIADQTIAEWAASVPNGAAIYQAVLDLIAEYTSADGRAYSANTQTFEHEEAVQNMAFSSRRQFLTGAAGAENHIAFADDFSYRTLFLGNGIILNTVSEIAHIVQRNMEERAAETRYSTVIEAYRELANCENKGETEIQKLCDKLATAANIFGIKAEYELWSSCIDARDSSLGYAIHDINGDGISELVILSEDYFVHAIYSLCEGAPTLVGAYWSRSNCTIAESGALVTRANSGATDWCWAVYSLEPESAQLQLLEMAGMESYNEQTGEQLSSSRYYQIKDGTRTIIDEAAFGQWVYDNVPDNNNGLKTLELVFISLFDF